MPIKFMPIVWSLLFYQAWELSAKTQISAAVKMTFRGEKKNVRGEKKSAVDTHTHTHTHTHTQGSAGFSSAPNTRETYGARSHAAIARLDRVIVNTVTCGLATGLNAVVLTRFCALFRLRKGECYKKV